MIKEIIKIIIVVACCFLNNKSLAQRIISLREFETLRDNYRNGVNTTDNGEDITYIKDVGNELTKYVGVWKGIFSGHLYEFTFEKKTDYKINLSDDASRDMLIGWITVKDNTGSVIYTNMGKTEKLNGFHGDNFQTGTNFYRLDFVGNCYNDAGQAFLFINPSGTMRFNYSNQADLKTEDCLSGFVSVLPKTLKGIILTQQH